MPLRETFIRVIPTDGADPEILKKSDIVGITDGTGHEGEPSYELRFASGREPMRVKTTYSFPQIERLFTRPK